MSVGVMNDDCITTEKKKERDRGAVPHLNYDAQGI